MEREGDLSAFDAAVAANLRRSTGQLIQASIDMNCRLTAVHKVIQDAHASGRMVSALHLIIAATARALPSFQRLMSFVWEGSIYRHKAIDVAFVARAGDGRLFTPVLRGADKLSIDEIAKTSQAMTMKAMRGSARAEELEGAAFTISQVPVPGTAACWRLPSFGQSAILGVSAERVAADVVNGAIAPVPMVTLTLNYDHALCDGVYAAQLSCRDREGPRSVNARSLQPHLD